MATIEHIEVEALQRDMPVVLAGEEIGRLEDIIPQPDLRHVLRLITRRASERRLLAIPIEWVRDVRDGRVELWVTQAQLAELPEYVPTIPVSEARKRVQRALDEHPTTAGRGIQVTNRNDTLELHGRVPDAQTRTAASAIARGVAGVGPVQNLLGTDGEPRVSPAGHGYPWLHSL